MGPRRLAAFDAEGGPHGGLPEAYDACLADLVQAQRQANACQGLPLAQGSRGHCRHDHVLAVGPVLQAVEHPERDLGPVLAVEVEFILVEAEPLGNLGDVNQFRLLGYLKVAEHARPPLLRFLNPVRDDASPFAVG